jgi:hypothetical protein
MARQASRSRTKTRARSRRHSSPRYRLQLHLLESRVLPSGGQLVALPEFDPPPVKPHHRHTPPEVNSSQQVTPAIHSPLVSTPLPQTVAPGAGFVGVSLQDEFNNNPGGSGFIPPDTMGAVGPNQFVELINGRFAVYSRAGVLVSSQSLDQFWSAAAPVGGTSDPHIVYDKHSGRWFTSTIDINNGSTNNHLLVGVSATSDPTGSWAEYRVSAGNATEFADFDTMGVDDNGVYFGTNMFPTSGTVHAAIFATAKAPLLSATTITVFEFDNIPDMYASPQPAFNFDTVAATDPAWFVSSSNAVLGHVEYRTLTWGSGGTPSLSATTDIVTPAFGSVPTAPSLNGTQNVDSGDQRLLMAVIRNGQLWTARTVGVNSSGTGTSPTRDAAEFLELQLNTAAASATLLQSGRAFDTAASNPVSYYYPSVMVNSQGYMVMGFSGSSTATFVGAYATARLSTNPLGALQSVTLLKAGLGAYTITFGGTRNRWGDYSYTSLDPTDDKTIWTIQEYAAATVPPNSGAGNSTSRWGTWINPFTAPTSSATTTAVSSSPNPSALGQPVIFTATVSPTSGTGTPTGTVTFEEGTNVLASGVSLNGSARATFSTGALGIGNHTLTAVYSGDTTFGGSQGDDSSLPQVVNADGTTTTIASSVNPSVFGQAVTFTATVAASPPGAGTPTGLVTFKDGAATLGIRGLNGSAQATFSTSALSAVSHTVTAIYGGDGNFSSSTSNALAQIVNADTTSTALVSFVNPSLFGQAVTLTATVSAQAPGTGTPTGNVTFNEGTNVIGSASLNGTSRATFSVSTLSVGSHTLTASYGGDNNFTASQGDDSAAPQVVIQDPSTTAIATSVSPSAFGQAVTFTATVAALSPGAGLPTGSVAFSDGLALLGSSTLNPAGQATFSTAALAVGGHSITASYGGDNNFTASVSSLSQAVNPDGTTTTLASSGSPSVSGQIVTFTALVSAGLPGAGIPSGLVTFQDGAVTLGVAGLDVTGQATFSTSGLSVGGHTVTASYGGDGNYSASSSSVLNQTVNADGTSTAVASTVNPSLFGQRVTFTATVTAQAPGSGTPTGSLTFQENANVLAATVALDGTGRATFTTSALAVGSHTVTASYSGDGNFTSSQGDDSTLPQVVNTDSTTASIKSSANPSVFGQPVTFTATIRATAPGAGVPTGNVTFKDFGTVLGTGTLNGAGQATFSTTALSRSNHAISAAYPGDGNFGPSTSGAFGQTVSKDASVIAVSSAPNPSVFGQGVTLTAAVSAQAPGSGTPTGLVTFKEGTTVLGSGAVNGSGLASIVTATLAVGSHTVTASYGGDNNFLASMGDDSATPQVVNQDAVIAIVKSSVNPAVFGQVVTFTANVLAKPPGSGTPTGTVTFMDFGSALGTASLSGGQATFSTASLARGNHSITFSYGGDTNFASGVAGAFGEPVNRGATTTAVGSAPNPSVMNTAVTFTATISVTSPAAGTPTGSVTFKEGTTVLGSGTLSAGQATFSTTGLGVGSHTITAVYAGDGNFLTSNGDDSASPQVVTASRSTAFAAVVQAPTAFVASPPNNASVRTPAPAVISAASASTVNRAPAPGSELAISPKNLDRFFASVRSRRLSSPFDVQSTP